MDSHPLPPDHDAIYTEVRTLISEGAPQAIDRATELLKSLAEAGHADAQIDLGFLLASGKAKVRDLTEAAHWFAMAAEAGEAQAQFNYGILLRHGQGVAADPAKATEMFLRAARQGSIDAAFNLAQMVREHAVGGEVLTEAVALLEQCADDKDGVKCAYAAGLAATEGWVGLPDIPRAVEFFRKAVAGGHTSAAYNLGLIYFYGQTGVPSDRDEALRLFTLAAEAGHEKAKQALADPAWQDKAQEGNG